MRLTRLATGLLDPSLTTPSNCATVPVSVVVTRESVVGPPFNRLPDFIAATLHSHRAIWPDAEFPSSVARKRCGSGGLELVIS